MSLPTGCYLDNNNCAPFLEVIVWKSEVIVLDRGIFLRERSSQRKIPRTKTITDEFTQGPKNRWCKVVIVINNRYFDNFVCFMFIFWQKHKENSIFYHFCTHPCKQISISPDVMIIARCDKCTNTGCIARDCLCVYADARMALRIMSTLHAEVIIRSHCYVIMTAHFFHLKLVIIYVDWIALLRRLLIENIQYVDILNRAFDCIHCHPIWKSTFLINLFDYSLSNVC